MARIENVVRDRTCPAIFWRMVAIDESLSVSLVLGGKCSTFRSSAILCGSRVGLSTLEIEWRETRVRRSA
jgi:hypothetical protein